MATIIEFYTPRNFTVEAVGVPSLRCAKVLPFRVNPAENKVMPVPVPTLRIMFANETEQKRCLPEEIISHSSIIRIAAREAERE